MVTLEEHEKAVGDAHKARLDHMGNGYPQGVQCPKCDGELYWKCGTIMTSYPAQMSVECNKCGLTTTITC